MSFPKTGAGGNGGGTSGGLTDVQLRATPLEVTPIFRAGDNLTNITVAGGEDWTQLPDQELTQLTIFNDTGFTLEFRQDGGAGTPPIWSGQHEKISGISNANQISVRRKDKDSESIEIQARWEKR